MENADTIRAHEERLQRLEASVESLSLRLGKTEDKASGAWNTIRETKEDVGDLYDKVDELEKHVKALVTRQATMETDVKIVKSEQAGIAKTLKWLTGGVIFLGIITGAFLFFMYRKDAALVKEILSFGAVVTTAIA